MPECVMEQACAVEEDEEEAAAAAAAAAPQPIFLEPFLHQVGGHSSMLRFDETTVCKPLVPREQCFYETIPEEMKEFTPQYRGVTKVQFAQDSEGYLTLVAYPVQQKRGHGRAYLDVEENSSGGDSPVSGEEDDDIDTTQSDSDSESTNISSITRGKPRQRFRIRRSGSIEMETSKKPKSKVHNPWYLRCYKVQLEKMKKSGMDTSSQYQFILLENLASDYKRPCILDLKMGTRQHGDDASEEKRLMHTHKCQVSTSSSLGTRVCGMQSYQASSGQYVCRDKYYGRTLGETGMHAVLYQFVHNGFALRRDVIAPLLKRLHGLHRVLSTLHTYRFYSSSLLLMYDGGDWEEGQEDAAATCNKCREQHEPDTTDTEKAYEDADEFAMQCDDSDSHDSTGAVGAGNKDWHAGAAAAAAASSCPHTKPPKVDIRMIDFAHVTHQGFRGDRIVHEGPDHGYLFGLENLIQMFEEILEHGGQGLELMPLPEAASNGQIASTSSAATSK